MVAAIDDRAQREGDRRDRAQDAIAHDGGVRPELHRQAFLDERARECKLPHGRRSVEIKSLEVQIAARIDRARAPAIGREVVRFAQVRARLIELRAEQRPAARRLERGDEQPVIAARQRTVDRARGIAADAVRYEPLARVRRRKIAADVATEIDRSAIALVRRYPPVEKPG